MWQSIPILERVIGGETKCQKGLQYVLDNGKKIRFWYEVWWGDCPLKYKFSKFYTNCKQQKWEVVRVLQGGGIHLNFRRNFDISKIAEWEEFE
jgi:hypothetical protein